MKQRKKGDVAILLDYAGSHRRLTFLGLGLSAVSMLMSLAPVSYTHLDVYKRQAIRRSSFPSRKPRQCSSCRRRATAW